MATCKKGVAVPVPPPVNYTLVLTEVEAQTLHAILRKIGGCPHKSLRREADDIYKALNSSGIVGLPDTGVFQENGGLYFLSK